jgi:hypothetical protein
MPKVSYVESRVRNIEGFAIVITWHHGGDVRGDKKSLSGYPYRQAASGNLTVADWKRTRFSPNYPGFYVMVLEDRGHAVVGNTKLATLRERAD